MSEMLVSTRDELEIERTYGDALLEGLAPDGGLFVPSKSPESYSEVELQRLLGLPYWELVSEIKSKFVGHSIPRPELNAIAREAYNPKKFPYTVEGIVTPVRKVGPGLIHIQNLSLGLTAAFKDLALQMLGGEMGFTLQERNERLDIAGATSGDTGSSAEAAVHDQTAIRIFMLSPSEGMSDFQKAQMGHYSGERVHNISVAGSFNDCQDIVKKLNEDPEFSDLGAVNSINWSRITSQIAYYFAGYFQVAKGDFEKQVDFVVPTGNFGNVLAGYIAKQMGLPIRNLIIATNENNVVHNLIQTGEYVTKESVITSSPSMDITKASNYERLVYELLDRDPTATALYMREFADNGRVSFEDYGLPPDTLQAVGFMSDTSIESDRLESIRWVYEVSGKKDVIDPHTADAVTVARRYETDLKHGDKTPIICMETALPVKFEKTINEALGFVPEREERFRGIEESYDPEKAFYTVTGIEGVKDIIRQVRAA